MAKQRSAFFESRGSDWRPHKTILSSYLESFQWAQTQARYRASGLPCECLLCGKKRYQLHHTDYRHLGNESVISLRPLCRDHHKELHQLLNRRVMKLDQTDEALRYLSNLSAEPAEFERRMATFSAYPMLPKPPKPKPARPDACDIFSVRRHDDPQAVIDALLAQNKRQAVEINRLLSMVNQRQKKKNRKRRRFSLAA